MMDHRIISKYTDVRVKISGWDERVQQFPKDCPCCSVGVSKSGFKHNLAYAIRGQTLSILTINSSIIEMYLFGTCMMTFQFTFKPING